MAKHNDYIKSVAIAQAVAACINAEGGIGPCGGVTAEPDDNTINIYSQACDNTYEFHENGTVDLLYADEAYDSLIDVYGCDEDELEEYCGSKEDFISANTGMTFEDFMSAEKGWFQGSKLEDACIAFVKAIISAK